MIQRRFDGSLELPTRGQSRQLEVGSRIDFDSGGPQPIAELIQKYESKFVLLTDCRFDATGRVTHGRVILASEDAEVVYYALAENANSVVVFLGPDGEEVDGAFLDAGDAYSEA